MESEKQYAMFIHLSQLAGSIVVGLGWILPLVLWLTKKDSSEYIDANGKIVMNWIISCLIYGIVSGILCLIGIGVVLLIALAICNLTFIIIGSVKQARETYGLILYLFHLLNKEKQLYTYLHL